MRLTSAALAALAAVVLVASPVYGQAPDAAVRPRIANGDVLNRSATSGLAALVRGLSTATRETVWVGYAVPVVPGDHDNCCWDAGWTGLRGGCRLEPQAAKSAGEPSPPTGPIPLEPADALVVMMRLDAGQVERIRLFSPSCPLDAGGRTVYWLSGVQADDSVAFLSTYAAAQASRRLVDGAMSAIAMHASPRALDWLLATARAGQTTHLRSQSLFWLSQRAGQRAVGTIAEAIEKDPDTDVKKRAVFALSQLPADDGVPRLITLARAHSNPVVRKQAFFWLGQSQDPRALAFFRDVLTK